jgi:hypothetical protein
VFLRPENPFPGAFLSTYATNVRQRGYPWTKMTHSDAFATDVWDMLAEGPGDLTELRVSAVRALFRTRRPIPRSEFNAALRDLAFDVIAYCDNPTPETGSSQLRV